MAWLNRLFYDKNKKITFSNTEDQACEKQSCEGKLPRLDIGKNVGRVTMSRNPFLDLKEIELRDLSKHQIDALEQWCRRLIDDIFKQNYGGFYIDAEVNPGQPLIKSSIKRTIEERRKQDPTRFPRWIDGIVMEDLEYYICRDDLYSKYFRKIFEPFYSGKEEIRFVLQRLTAVRNRIAHGNAISVHEAEQALC